MWKKKRDGQERRGCSRVGVGDTGAGRVGGVGMKRGEGVNRKKKKKKINNETNRKVTPRTDCLKKNKTKKKPTHCSFLFIFVFVHKDLKLLICLLNKTKQKTNQRNTKSLKHNLNIVQLSLYFGEQQ